MSINTSSLARQLRGLIYDKMMTGRATDRDRAEADRIALILCPNLAPPSLAKSLIDLEKIGRAAFARLDSTDRVADYADAERALEQLPQVERPKLPPEEGEEWKQA